MTNGLSWRLSVFLVSGRGEKASFIFYGKRRVGGWHGEEINKFRTLKQVLLMPGEDSFLGIFFWVAGEIGQ